MKKDGLQRMLDFLDMLRDKNIHSWIEQQSPDELMVTFTLVGVRVEANFSVDEMTFSVFKGNEDVETDAALLQELISKHWRDA